MINTKTSNKSTNTNNTKIAGAMTTKNTAYIPPRNTDINGDLSDKIIITTKDSHTPTKLNGGKNNSANPSNYKIDTPTITLAKPTRLGYTFEGWYSDSSFKTKVNTIEKGSTGDKTFFAKTIFFSL